MHTPAPSAPSRSGSSTETGDRGERGARAGRAVRLGLALTLALLLAHAAWYRFLTDDAFISFRYARNLAAGEGLVFNPGGPPVEGFTNALWTLLLAAAGALGASHETAALVLSIAATVGTWWVVVALTRRLLPAESSPAWVLVSAGLFALTRSVAVWSTGGLETRAYEFLLAAGVLRVLAELGGTRPGGTGRVRGVGALLLALAALTRPDGLLTGGAVLAMAAVPELAHRRWSWAARSALVFGGVALATFLLRHAYFGAWLPNTWYAKVDGRSWWPLGWRYLGAFILEYALWSWVPLVLAAAMSAVRDRGSGRGRTVAVLAAAVLPHALYLASIGGDHFEWRPLGPVFVFGWPLVAAGAAVLARRTATRVVLALCSVLIVIGTLELPLRSRLEFPRDRYRPGFPAWSLGESAGAEWLAPERGFTSRLPGFAWLAERHRRLLWGLSNHFAALRQEEHMLFRERVEAEATRLLDLKRAGLLPADTRVALDCVGVIPYRTDFWTLDRVGLTDAAVAHGAWVNEDLMAHGKRAGLQYVVDQRVDLYAANPVMLTWERGDPMLLEHLARDHDDGQETWFARTPDGNVIWAWLPAGVDAARRRFPGLDWKSTLDGAAIRELARDWE